MAKKRMMNHFDLSTGRPCSAATFKKLDRLHGRLVDDLDYDNVVYQSLTGHLDSPELTFEWTRFMGGGKLLLEIVTVELWTPIAKTLWHEYRTLSGTPVGCIHVTEMKAASDEVKAFISGLRHGGVGTVPRPDLLPILDAPALSTRARKAA